MRAVKSCTFYIFSSFLLQESKYTSALLKADD